MAQKTISRQSAAVHGLLTDAIREHQAGRLEQAKQLYLQVLAIDVKHAKSLYGLGLIAHQVGNLDVAASMMRRAIAIEGDAAAYRASLGLLLLDQGRTDEAAAEYRQLVKLKPDSEDAHSRLAKIFLDQRRLSESRPHMESAIALNPNSAATQTNMGLLLMREGKPEEALVCYQRALTLDPSFTEALCNLGNLLCASGKLEEAKACYERAIMLRPDLAEAHNNLGVVFRDLGLLGEAQACCERALELKPDFVNAHNNLGIVLQDQDKFDQAAASLERALELKPDYAEAYNNLGNTRRSQGRLEDALRSYEQALALNPNNAEALNNLGTTYRYGGKLDESAACHERALELRPEYFEAHNDLGNTRRSEGRIEEALRSYAQALTLDPNNVEAGWNRSLVELLTGDFAAGWRDYEIRSKRKKNDTRVFPQPIWRGGPLNGARILLHAEQGLGDTVQFLRYAPMVQAAGGTVILDVPKSMLRLAAGLRGVATLVATGEELPPFEWHCPLMSLPLAFGTSIETIPAQVPYFDVPVDAANHAESLPWPGEGLRIGLVWSGNPLFPDDRLRSIPLSGFEALLRVEGTRFFSLQMGQPASQLSAIDAEVTDLQSAIGDMADTAALIGKLDLVIAVDTAVAHLAGALGKPVWVLLPFAPDWRWLMKREDSPWYPTMRLFRQARFREWGPVLERVRGELEALAGSKV